MQNASTIQYIKKIIDKYTRKMWCIIVYNKTTDKLP